MLITSIYIGHNGYLLPEQSGFRGKQGCLLPVFTLVIMVTFCLNNQDSEVNKDAYYQYLHWS